MQLRQFLDMLSHPVSVMTIGDVMLDVYVTGWVERISPEAPVPVLLFENEKKVLGGAGNVYQNLASLGAKVKMLAVLNDDEQGIQFRELANNIQGGEIDIIHDSSRPTATKTRWMTKGKHLLRVDTELPQPIPASVAKQLVQQAQASLPRMQGLILSDYRKGVLTDRVVAQVLAEAEKNDRLTFVDPKGHSFAHYKQATLLTPNLIELAAAAGVPRIDNTDEEVSGWAQKICQRDGLHAMLVTRGAYGMSYFQSDTVLHCPVFGPFEVHDVAGAGDTVIAAIAYALLACREIPLTASQFRNREHLDLIEPVCQFANAAAGQVVRKPGTASVTIAELKQDLLRRDTASETKITDLDLALPIVNRWRLANYRIGVTNGCFDLLHSGHIHLLAWAKKHCDRLVVLINSDDSVRRLKGSTRPIMSLAQRTTVLAALASVDLVVPFSDDTPLAAIQLLRPDVLIKGEDYRYKEVAGAEPVMQSQGQLLFCPLVDGCSTTAIVEKIRSLETSGS